MRRPRVRFHQPDTRGPRDPALRALRPVCEELAGRLPGKLLAGTPQARPEVERVPRWSAERRASRIATGGGTPRKRAGVVRRYPGGLASPRVSPRPAPLARMSGLPDMRQTKRER